MAHMSVGGVSLPNFQTKALMVLPVHGAIDFVIIIPFNDFLYGWLCTHVLTKPDEDTRPLTMPGEDSDRSVSKRWMLNRNFLSCIRFKPE